MKKTFFFLAMLANIAASAQRTTDVTIANTNVDYSQKTVTFALSWKGSDATHRDEVWVFVDIQPIIGVTKGSWTPATLVPSATTVTALSGNQYSSLTYATVSGNTRGVWVKGTSSATTNTFNSTVKLKLDATTPAKFNACAYATDYPPNAVAYNNGSYTLKGTKPFIINGVTVNDTKYAITKITSLTDATGCPGGVGRDAVHNGGACMPGLTAVGSYCRDLVADAAIKAVCGQELEAKNRYQTTYYTNITTLNCPAGWRPPTRTEVECIYVNYRTQCNLPTETWLYFSPHSYTNSAWDGADGAHCVTCDSNTAEYHLLGYNFGTYQCWYGATYGQIVPMCNYTVQGNHHTSTICVR
jgi:archaellum component FlaF (FlaF/FlaG flagellin family)